MHILPNDINLLLLTMLGVIDFYNLVVKKRTSFTIFLTVFYR